jgi:catechol 2,3-dioxygenase-like lactoylglutathione lyase family enzyme
MEVDMRFVNRLDHLAIAAADTTALVAWYERVLGLVVHLEREPKAPQTQKVYFIGPPVDGAGTAGVRQGMMIEVMPRNDTPRHERNSHEPGLSHAAWAVSDFDRVMTHLKECGVKLLGETIQAMGGGRLQSFLDCEGNMMQIVERR